MQSDQTAHQYQAFPVGYQNHWTLQKHAGWYGPSLSAYARRHIFEWSSSFHELADSSQSHCFFVPFWFFMSLSTIFQSYHDSVWVWQGAQCSLLECCLTEISAQTHDMIFHPVTLYWHWADLFALLSKYWASCERAVSTILKSLVQLGWDQTDNLPITKCMLYQMRHCASQNLTDSTYVHGTPQYQKTFPN